MLVDVHFFKLTSLLFPLKTAIATSEVHDVREVLDFYNQFDDPIEAFRENQRKLQVKLTFNSKRILKLIQSIFFKEQQELMERMNQEKQSRPATSVARGLFGRRF